MLVEGFIESEPLTVAGRTVLDVDDETYKKCVYFELLATFKTSWATVIVKKDDQVVGVGFCFDNSKPNLFKEADDSYTHLSKDDRFEPKTEFWGYYDEFEDEAVRKFPSSNVLKADNWVVAKSEQGNKLSEKIMEQTIAIAHENGFEFVVATCTHKASERCFIKKGPYLIQKKSYRDIEVDNAIFSCLKETELPQSVGGIHTYALKVSNRAAA